MRLFKKNVLYHNALFIQMTGEDKETNPDAMVVRGDKIIALGKEPSLRKEQKIHKSVDLGGGTVLPGLFDAHGHFLIEAMAETLFVPLFSVPIGEIKTIDDIVATLKTYDEEHPQDTIIGFGYDDTKLAEGRLPDRHDLDKVSEEKPVIAMHQSFHIGSANTKALEIAGIDEHYEAPEGSVVYKDEDGFPTGAIEETPALMPLLKKILFPFVKRNHMFNVIARGSKEYLSHGITTANEGAGLKDQMKLYKLAALFNKLKIRLIFNVLAPDNLQIPETKKKQGEYVGLRKRLTMGPVKLFTDGSIQGYTAYLKKPYHVQSESRDRGGDYRGYPRVDEEKYERAVKTLNESGRQYAVHANGDAAIEQVVTAEEKTHTGGKNIVIHAQTTGIDQLKRMKKVNLSPSFFPMHDYVWGKNHREIYLGEERASKMNPTRSAEAMGINYTIHIDSPVTPVNPWGLIWAAVNREDETGKPLGKDEAVSPYQAIKAITANAAEQYCIKDRGQLVAGNLADFILVDQNPLVIDKQALWNVNVIKTYLGGKLVYQK